MTRRATGRTDGQDGRETYHHGMLREALIRATDEILSEHGAAGFTLREAARRAGVSAAAPAHHFGSAAGLLTAVAIAGFDELTEVLRREGADAPTGAARVRAQGMGYVRFALAHPGRFGLMFQKDLLVPADAGLDAAGRRALAELEASVRAYLAERGGLEDEGAVRATVLAAWSTVHGYAHLALDGKFAALAGSQTVEDFVSETLPDVLVVLLPEPAGGRRSRPCP